MHEWPSIWLLGVRKLLCKLLFDMKEYIMELSSYRVDGISSSEVFVIDFGYLIFWGSESTVLCKCCANALQIMQTDQCGRFGRDGEEEL